ncbi:hypothetical protein [uncultured Azohydromonas sp.]|jgi:hypothetical protein|uniref:hypothetical protein n=1 Tax=uncultured Azohydromonas sp. TaxID=487342 RepID=UPI00262AFA7E|nr:hypothetical protein [uncultured Azohydromonas sp.]
MLPLGMPLPSSSPSASAPIEPPGIWSRREPRLRGMTRGPPWDNTSVMPGMSSLRVESSPWVASACISSQPQPLLEPIIDASLAFFPRMASSFRTSTT